MPLTPQQKIERAEQQLERLKAKPVTSFDLIKALELKHSGDVLITECKDGPTQTASHRRLDAWAMLKTWSPITMIGYEIKVSRSDWLQDQKFIDYLPLCHRLNIVAPRGVVELEELPADVGLLEPIGDLSRLITRRKSVYRHIELPAELLVYVIMCRMVVGTPNLQRGDDPDWRRKVLRQWVESDTNDRNLSYAVNNKIRQIMQAQEERNRALDQRCRDLEGVKKRILELGLDPEAHMDLWAVHERVKALAGVVDENLLNGLKRAETALATVRHQLEDLRDKRSVEP